MDINTNFVPMTRLNHRRDDGLSTSLQLAKAAEHLVCSELLIQGYNAFLADAGLPYDLVVDRGSGQFWRVQVKSTCDMMSVRRKGGKIIRPLYRFALRRSRCGDRRITLDAADYLACVALDIRAIAFLHVSDIVRANGFAVSAVEFKTRQVVYPKGRTGPDPMLCGRFMEDYREFKPVEVD